MSRSRYFSNRYSTIQASAMGCRQEQEQLGGNFLKGFQNTLAAIAPIAMKVGEQALVHHLSRVGQGTDNLQIPTYNNMPGAPDSLGRGNMPNRKQGGSFGNTALQLASVPSTSQSRDLRGNGSGGSSKKVRSGKGYIFKK
mgnify:CR=1 FL=1